MENNKIKIDLSKITATDLNGAVHDIPDINSRIGNLVFLNARTIELDRIARELHGTGISEVTEDEINYIIELVEQYPIYVVFVEKAIIEYLSSHIND